MEHQIISPETLRSQLVLRVKAVSAAAALALAACSGGEGEASRSTTTETPAPLASAETTETTDAPATPPDGSAPEVTESPRTTVAEEAEPQSCSFRPISPESAFNYDNKDSIQTHLGVVQTAHDTSTPVRLSDYAHATAIFTNVLRDPVYALAISDANETIKSGGAVAAEQLLAGDYASQLEYCQPNYLTKEHASQQLGQFNTLFDDLLLNMGPQSGRQLTESLRSAYEVAKQGVENLRDRFEGS